MNLNDIDLKTWLRYEKIRALYERHPALYRLRLVLLLLFGLTNIFVLLVFVFLHVLLFYMGLNDLGYGKITLGVGLMVFAAGICFMGILAMFSRSRLDCMPLAPERYGRLYDEVRDICRDLSIPPIRKIYLDLGTNIVVVPRFKRLPLAKRDILVIGYPLICALDEKTFRIGLTRNLWYEMPHARDTLLKWIGRIWSLPPVLYNPDTGSFEDPKALPPWFDVSFFPLRAKEEQAGEAYCRDAFGVRDFNAFLMQVLVRGEFDMHVLLLRKLAAGDAPVEHPAAIVRDEIRRDVPEAKTKRIVERMLRSFEPVMETLPPFRERVGTDDPADLLPYLERTPDAAESYLFSCPEFEAEFDEYLNGAICRAQAEFEAELENDDEDFDELEDEPRENGESRYERMLKDEDFDESSDERNVWTDALNAASTLLHEERTQDILEKAVKKFPDDLVFRGTLLVCRMRTAATAQEESEAASELERLAEQDPFLALAFHGELFGYAVRRGDTEYIHSLLVRRESTLKKFRKTMAAGLNDETILEPCTDGPEVQEKIAEYLSAQSLGIDRAYFVIRRYSNAWSPDRVLYLKRKNNLRRFLTDDQTLANRINGYTLDLPVQFLAKVATKKELKVLEAKHIPFVRIKR